MDALEAARHVGVTHMGLLSAICVQKPIFAFQHAKLAFENALIASGLSHSIVWPTAFFKSLWQTVLGRTRFRPWGAYYFLISGFHATLWTFRKIVPHFGHEFHRASATPMGCR